MTTAGMNIVGYADKLSVKPGQALSFMVSTTSAKYSARVVRLLGGMTDLNSMDLPMEPVFASCNGEYPGRRQETNLGSHAELPLAVDWMEGGEFTVQLWIWPSKPGQGNVQTVWSAKASDGRTGADLAINQAGQLVFSLRDSADQSFSVRTEHPVAAKTWYFVVAQFSAASSQAVLHIIRQDGWTPEPDRHRYTVSAPLNYAGVTIQRVLLGAASRPGVAGRTHQHFNGKIENPRFFRSFLEPQQVQQLLAGKDPSMVCSANVVAEYDFGAGISTSKVVDRSPGGHHGVLHQAPTRGVTSHAWTGQYLDFRSRPDHYAAVHFHEDDVEDAGWEADFTWLLPADLKSGIYALQLDAGGVIDYIPFFVSPCQATAPVLFLAPTNTYLAYANERLFEVGLDAFMAHELKLAPQDHYMLEHPEVGKSAYDKHTDGSGVCYSSRLRPILNIRPHYQNWLTGVVRHLAADLYITGWLDKRGQQYDVAIDEDLDREGIDLLLPYKVLITGTHPEYWTRPMMDALQQYLASGGRLMYLGANGFYWVTSIDPNRPYLAEVRRGNSGTRCWDSPPGEVYHSTTGEPGGLWRHNGYVPQKLVGVGFTAQGWGPGCGYRRLSDSFEPSTAIIFDGIGENEVIGDFGYVMGGAAGDEVDRLDFDLGTPSHTKWLATSTGLDNRYQYVHEDLLMTAPGQGGQENELVRADMTYFDVAGGGAVFSVGSISWGGSMAWNDYDNNAARVCDNVLKHFLKV